MKKWLWISVIITFLGGLQAIIVPSYVQPNAALTQMNNDSRYYIMSNELYHTVDSALLFTVCVNWFCYFGVWTYKTYKECKNGK